MAVVGLAVLSARGAQSVAVAADAGSLRSGLDTLFSHPDYAKSVWACKVVDATTGNVLYAHNPDRRMVPASNQKLFVAAAALCELGPDYRGRTEFRGGPLEAGRLAGDLHVWGYGAYDFSARFPSERPVADRRRAVSRALDVFAGRLRAAGIAEISGELVAHSAGWTDMPRNTHYPSAAALVFHDNTLDVGVVERRIVTCPYPVHAFRLKPVVFSGTQERSGGQEAVTDVIRVNPSRESRDYWRLQAGDPLLYYIENLRTALRSRGVGVMGAGRIARSDEQPGPLLLVREGLPLTDLVGAMLTHSDNLRAESVFLQLAYRKTGQAGYAGAAKACEEAVRTRGLAGPDYRAADGSGLSRDNRASASDIIMLLRGMMKSPQFTVFRDSLAVAGQTGTLAERLQSVDVAGRIRGKTGSLGGVCAFSGYAETADGSVVCVSFLCNRSPEGERCWKTITAACRLICAFRQ